MLHEAEVHAGLVAGAQAVGGHVHDGGGLADGAAVHHGLVPVGRGGRKVALLLRYRLNKSTEGKESVPRSDGCRVVQHHYVPLKLPAGLRVQLWGNHYHS